MDEVAVVELISLISTLNDSSYGTDRPNLLLSMQSSVTSDNSQSLPFNRLINCPELGFLLILNSITMNKTSSTEDHLHVEFRNTNADGNVRLGTMLSAFRSDQPTYLQYSALHVFYGSNVTSRTTVSDLQTKC